MKSEKRYFDPDTDRSLTLRELEGADPETQKRVMHHWFDSNYENPAERTPYEGEYIYIWGGPYNAGEELRDVFEGHISSEIIDELVDELEGESYEWAAVPDLEPEPREVLLTDGLLLQSVIVPGERVPDGVLIQAVAIPWYEILKLLKEDPSAVFRIPPRKWEEIIAGAYKKAGFETVVLTPRSGDRGRDIIAEKRGIGRIRIIDQVKAYKPTHLVKADDVRALMGVLSADGASKGFLTTTSDFAPTLRQDPLIKPFIPSRIELVNGEALLKRLQEWAKPS